MSVLVFGEVLWDIFGEEKRIGGAPLNFAAHLARLGEAVSLITAVGEDALGTQTLDIIRDFQISADYVKQVPQPTGICQVTLDEHNSPHYDLVGDVAYDFIDLSSEKLQSIKEQQADVLYMGTLSQRSEISRSTANCLLEQGGFRDIFCDINIRKPFYSRDILESCLKSCTILKISREEYRVLEELGLVEVSGEEGDYTARLCRALAQRWTSIRLILVTLDKDGALLYDVCQDRILKSDKPQSKLKSAVGAGDSFSAAFLHNYLSGEDLPICLNRGIALSDYVVTQLGAVPDYPPALFAQIHSNKL
ncbi:MAG: PfkB family carbohydrate kinase [Oscillospiraceae bacterium]|nr:PfkB family carbohydrate kinase [Oscillospiraceae bacterium]